jgi:hypothetical protein
MVNKFKKMTLCFVDDQVKEVQEVIEDLKETQLFEIRHYGNYAVPEDIVINADLFILDVLMGTSSNDFYIFARVLRDSHKPFLAFTSVYEKGELQLPGSPVLREVVYQHGGIGIVSKRPDPTEQGRVAHEDLRFALVERILNFYWCRNPD